MDLSSYLKSNQRLYEETLNEFSSKSYDYASLNEIVKRSEFNKGSFYYRFADKLELYQALIDLVNSEHIGLYNQRILDRISEASYVDIAMEAIASLADLYQLDVRFVRLLERFALESMSFQESVALKGIAFVHLRFEVEFRRLQSRFDDQSYRGFLSLFRFYYFSQSLFIDKFDRMHLIRASLLAFGQPSVESLNDDGSTLSTSSMLEMNQYRLLLILGNRLSGKSSIAKKNAIEASIQYNSVLLLDGVDQSLIFYKSSRPIRYSFRQIESKAKRLLQMADKTDPIHPLAAYLRLINSSKSDRSIDLRLRYVCLWVMSQRIDALILDEAFIQASASDETLIFNTILKFRSRGVTMVLTNQPNPSIVTNCSHIAFLSSHGLSSPQPISAFQANYPVDSLLVRYLEEGIEKRQMWSDSPWLKPEFASWLAAKKILEIRSISLDIATVYKIETGEVLS